MYVHVLFVLLKWIIGLHIDLKLAFAHSSISDGLQQWSS